MSEKIYKRLYDEFMLSEDNLRVYDSDKLLFASTGDRLLPLMEYIEKFNPCHRQVTIMDRLVGNAAALLAIKANCRQLFSPLASQHAVATLQNHGIGYHFTVITPYIKKDDSEDMCPMEKLSLNKEPEEFYQALRNVMSNHRVSK